MHVGGHGGRAAHVRVADLELQEGRPEPVSGLAQLRQAEGDLGSGAGRGCGFGIML